ncbi:c-type cytochrome [Allopusillimonas soli]|uniref:C-type cytochrome n=1 Tax=Allopusillimonas soli TaxID=659016 RepID=A0A853FFH0_9BURK|nr:c-type cytochrome [Allopusillimonas soli]NYT37251.1 c-type cytochrome [Allopusillimonas soli]TEA74892.1 c-type cytochrome [Allopusillimonas soli]
MKRMLVRFIAACGLVVVPSVLTLAQAADLAVARPDAAKGEQLFTNGDASRGIVACASCHGAGGNSTIPANPNLASMPHEYIAKQLMDFAPQSEKHPPLRSGPDGAPSVMTPFASALTAEDKQNLALYLSQQKLDWDKAGTATNKDTMDLGQRIWRGGLPERHVPACAGCHSPNGAGVPGQFPRLAGQHPDYLAAQLRLFRSGDRNNSDIMHAVADRMSDADIAAVADYAAGLR